MLAVHRAMTAPRPPSRAISYRPLSDQTNYQLRALVSATLGDIQLRLVRRTSGTTATIVDSTDTGIPFVAGVWYWLKFQTLGSSPTTLRGRIWREASPEPTTWLIDTTNNTAGNKLRQAASAGSTSCRRRTRLPSRCERAICWHSHADSHVKRTGGDGIEPVD
jgi:hypothetical protein